MNTQELQAALVNFYGSETIYQSNLNPKVVYTEGAKFFFQNAGGGAYWLHDIFATEFPSLHSFDYLLSIKVTSFQNKADIDVRCEYRGEETQVYDRHIEYTDLPEGEWKFFMIDDGERMTVMLPSEY